MNGLTKKQIEDIRDIAIKFMDEAESNRPFFSKSFMAKNLVKKKKKPSPDG